jgi:hypothetical protein
LTALHGTPRSTVDAHGADLVNRVGPVSGSCYVVQSATVTQSNDEHFNPWRSWFVFKVTLKNGDIGNVPTRIKNQADQADTSRICPISGFVGKEFISNAAPTVGNIANPLHLNDRFDRR